ncbi:class I SAM-dependent methyltransferase [Capnocytophaga periodontitidis]|uniref:class I SAM-dependent methyltransferase n=1 Tax=Capnocytophaga periodontitidis TaxID=2795027 RepID=UPI0018E1C22D|nr:class I SAM-dependent methyltransferase [Capnocytophaga periodontitidis]MBI1669707.1 class I SAM-dependent methyltransferase [Capnocytophaga periodontitidis]
MKTETSLNEKQGHWILAKLGKKVLRPGGRVLSEWLVKNLEITSKDDIVEFAPGLGFTANIACSYKPFSYTGVDMNEAAATLAKKNIHYENARVIVADAAASTLPDAFANKVYGEAMLTMQPLEHKKAIIAEAFRILKPGGYYAIHELGLQPDNVSDEVKNDVFKELSANIRVHARPMTSSEWKALFEEQGFKVVKEQHNAMLLLENKRVWQDEGIFRTLKFFFNLFTHPDLRKRVMNMKKTFRKHQKNLDAIALVAQKPL